MNNLLIGEIVIFVLLVIGIIVGFVKKRVSSVLLFVPGLLLVIAGIYFAPASMWRNISKGLLVVGLVFEIIAIVCNVKIKKKDI